MEEEKNYTNFKVRIENNEVIVDGRLRKLCELLNSLLELNPDDEIPLDEISQKEFNKAIEFAEMHDYNPSKVKRPLESNRLEENLCEKDFKFIKDY